MKTQMKYLFIILGLFIAASLFAQVDVKQHVLYEEIKTKYQSDVSNKCDTFKANVNDEEAKGRVDFLNKDFSTRAFSKNNSVAYWYCNTSDSENKRMHIGMISILFNSEKETVAALKKIESAKRTNFKVKLLTKFKVKASKKELLIIFTETVRNKSTAVFWERI
jgi:hypothetical protein